MRKVYILFILDKNLEQFAAVFAKKPTNDEVRATVARLQLVVDETKEECDQFYLKEIELFANISEINRPDLVDLFKAEAYADGFDPTNVKVEWELE